MEVFVMVVLALVLLFSAYRLYWLYRPLPREFTVDFDGDFYQMGETVIAVRAGGAGASRTIVCFPGFVEDMRYFLQLYADSECQLILVNNAAYHVPVEGVETSAMTAPANPYKCGTIEYDGFHLGQVIPQLAASKDIVLHGHSRGGAVVLETGRQYPELMRGGDYRLRAILEAAVLPGGKTAGKGSKPLVFALLCLFFPIVFGLSRKAPVEKLLQQPMMRPTNPHKTEICRSIYFTAKRYATCLVNMRSIRNWSGTNTADLYANFDHIDIVIGERDNVLDNRSMIASARAGAALNTGVRVHQTSGTNHFVTLERPELMSALV